jgi:hypothetical protein
MAETVGGLYFFLYPEGHLGLTAVTFLVTLPLMQVIVDFLFAAAAFSASNRNEADKFWNSLFAENKEFSSKPKSPVYLHNGNFRNASRLNGDVAKLL